MNKPLAIKRLGRTNGQQYVGLIVALLAALLLRAALASLPRVIRWDEPDYLWLGKSLVTGHGYTINGVPELHYTPLFPVLVGGIYRLVGDLEIASAFWYVLLGALTVVPVFFLARRIYNPRVALLAALFVAVFPALSSAVLYWGTMTEPLFIFLVYSALWAAVVALEEDRLWAYAASGALFSLAYLARPEGIMWLAAFGVLFVLIWAVRRQLLRRRTLARLGFYLVAFMLVAAPYAIYMVQHTGKLMATGKLSITYDIGEAVLENDPALYDKVTASLDPESGEILWWSERRFTRSMLDIVASDPVQFLTRIWRNAHEMRVNVFSALIFPLFLLAPVALGWFKRPWGGRRLRHEAALWFGVLPVLSFLPFHIEVRFFAPAFPALLIWLSAGIWALGDWLAETVAGWRGVPFELEQRSLVRWRLAMVTLLLVLSSAYMGVTHVKTVTRGMQDLSFAHKAAGLWLKANTPPQTAIMSRDLAVSLYAERGFVASPHADYTAYLDYARRKGASYLLVDERELRVLRPHLAFLLDDSNPPPELEPVFSALDERGRTLVYRIKDQNR